MQKNNLGLVLNRKELKNEHLKSLVGGMCKDSCNGCDCCFCQQNNTNYCSPHDDESAATIFSCTNCSGNCSVICDSDCSNPE